MTNITPLIRSDLNIIQKYNADGFKISGQTHQGAVIVTADKIVPWNFADDLANIIWADFESLLPYKDTVDVFLLGMGKTAPLLMPEIRRQLKANGLMVEVMDTGAACRTYNVLIAEGRRVAAALLPVV